MAHPRRIIPYDPDFLGGGLSVPLPALRGPALENSYEGGKPLDYTHFSIVMNRKRRLATYTACNIDGARAVRLARKGDWNLDDRIASNLQVDNSFYADNPWDRGHLVRRLDPVWGDINEARDADAATFFYTNAAPQHERFNQDEWQELEDWVLDHAVEEAYRACVITGPVFRDSDSALRNVQIPAAFWKVVVARDAASDGRGLLATAFLMKQDLLWNDTTGAKANHLTMYQVRIADIERVTCIDFGEAIRNADPLKWAIDRARLAGDADAGWKVIREPSDIEVWPDETPGQALPRTLVGAARSLEAPCACTSQPFDAERATRLLARQVTVDIDNVIERLSKLEAFLVEKGEPEDGRRLRQRLGALKIVGGVRVDEGEFEDCVCVGNASDFFCTGVLVGSNVVLTAGHCVPEKIDRVYFGRSVLSTIRPEAIRRVRRVERHPGYRSLSPTSTLARNDIAVLILDSPMSGVAPMALVDPSTVPLEDPDLPGELTRTALVGFGNTNQAGDYGFGIKRYVETPITALRRTITDDLIAVERAQGFNSATEFVAGIENKDTCTGDSGGPAYLHGPSPARAVLGVLGLTSRSTAASRYACGDSGIYTLVWPYRAWIEEVAKAYGGSLSWRQGIQDEPLGGSSIVAAEYEPGCC